MKRMLLGIIIIILFSGCSLGDTPTSRVEEYLSTYQRLDDNVSLSYAQLSGEEYISDELRDEYQKLIERQYKNLAYEVKEEMIDGRSASVTVQVKVFDYKKIIDKYNEEDYDGDDYHKFIVDKLNVQKDKITYTITIELIINDKDEWEVVELDLDERRKLLGIN